MTTYLEIRAIHAREILDSRGNPTVEADVTVWDRESARSVTGTAAVPSGASTGQFEAVELRDGERRYFGLGVERAVRNVNEKIAGLLVGKNALEQIRIDREMIGLDGTENKSNLGANAMLSVSLACARASAAALGIPLYRYVGGSGAHLLPVPMMNILNGGRHAANNVDFQEFMIMPVSAPGFREALRMGAEVYHSLKKVLSEKGLSTAVGDEGGFAPDVDGVEGVLDLLVEAVKRAGYQCGRDVFFAMDVAASEWKSGEGKGSYHMPKSGRDYKTDELIDLYGNMVDKYPILSIEDPLDEEDWDGWQRITKKLGGRVQLVGDDLFVTNKKRLAAGIGLGTANSVLVKVNQIGTLTEAFLAVELAHKNGYTAVMSHRSGETEDTTIADLAVAWNTAQIKTGAPCRSDRAAKYNRLLQIEEELSDAAEYPGMTAFSAK